MRAVILAGGKGTRLHPYTEKIPKPLVSIGGGETMLGIIMRQLSGCGFDHITLAVNHLAQSIIDYIGDGSTWGVRADYYVEHKPLGTMAPLTLIPDLPDNFLAVNGDTLTNLDYGDFLSDHMRRHAEISVAVKRRDVKIDFGVLTVDQNKKLTGFEEKPTHTSFVAMGVNCFSKKVIDRLLPDAPYGFDDLMKDGLAQGKDIFVHEHENFWLDVGRPEDYHYAVENYQEIKEILRV